MIPIKSLRVKTVIWASIPVIFVIAIVATITPYVLEDMARTVARQRDVELAKLSSIRLSEKLEYHSRHLQEVATRESFRSMEPGRVQTALTEARAELYIFDCAVVAYNSHRVAFASHPSSSERRNTLFPIAAEFEKVQRTLRPAFSDVFRDPVTGEHVTRLTVPILGTDGEFVGVLAGISTLRYSLLTAVYAQLLEFKADRAGYAYLVDGNGRVIYHRDSSQIGKSLTDRLPVKAVVANQTGSDLTRDASGEYIIVGYAPVPGTGWGLITQETWDLIINPIRRDRVLLLSLLVVGGIFANVLIFLAVSRALQPIHDLTTGARRIAEGDFDYVLATTTGDEIQTLSEQFNTMAAALRTSYSELERRVADRTADLAVAKEQAEEADRLKSDFLATMSHELRTPLNSVIGFNGILLKGMAGALNPEQEKQLSMSYKSAKHLLALINDILDLSKIEAGKVALASETFNIANLINKVAETVSPQLKKKSLKLEVSLSPEVDQICSDRRRVEQILLNVIDNAVKFTDKGTVRIGGSIVNANLQISVQDTGIGIKPEDVGKLFQSFRQIDLIRNRVHDGTGLGLAICKKLTNLLGGDIWVESEHGVGSKFTFTLPFDKNRPASQNLRLSGLWRATDET